MATGTRLRDAFGRALSVIGAGGLLAALALAAAAQVAPLAPPRLTPAERTEIVDVLSRRTAFDDGLPADRSDAGLWAALVRRATAELGLRLTPSDIDPLWAIEPRPRQVDGELRAAQAAGRLGPWLAAMAPTAQRYHALLAVRARYRQIVDAGGWPLVPKAASGKAPDPTALEPLRARLAAEGYLSAGPATAPKTGPAAGQGLDAGLKQAVSAFQSHHQLKADGLLNAQTLAALNVPATARLAQIDANLERWRWLPPLPAQRVEVDIGAAEATLYLHDQAQLSMRAIVGDRAHHTPMFASRLESVVFNPAWNVPASIAAKELYPHEHADPGYLARNDFVIVNGGLQQRPGPLNALGHLKFDLPSPFGVYLHDTPGRSAFGLANRWRSHGCVRLEKPRELAAALLGPQGWTAERIDGTIGTGDTSRTALAAPVPLFVLYWTVVVAPDGAPDFRLDTYGWDAKLTEALARSAWGRGETTQGDHGCRSPNGTEPLL